MERLGEDIVVEEASVNRESPHEQEEVAATVIIVSINCETENEG